MKTAAAAATNTDIITATTVARGFDSERGIFQGGSGCLTG